MENNYYEELIIKIKEHISHKKYEQALQIIKEELDLPYVPKKYEKELLNYLDQINNFFRKEVNSISFDKLISFLFNKKLSEFEKYQIVELFSSHNLKKEIEEIEKLLNKKEKELSFLIKSRIINQLLEQDLKEKISFLNKDDEKQEINLSEVTKLQFNKDFAKDSIIIQENLFKIPNALDMAFLMLENYYYSIFPNKPSINNISNYISLLSLQLLTQNIEFEKLLIEKNIDLEKYNQVIKSLSSIIGL